MQKAHDKVEWNFLLTVFEVFRVWVEIYHPIPTVYHYSEIHIVIKWQPMQQNRPLRGDPLSSYLFIICAVVLSRLLLREEQLVSLTRRNEAEVMADCVEKYCRWSGQTVNLAKSARFNLASSHQRMSLGLFSKAYQEIEAAGQLIWILSVHLENTFSLTRQVAQKANYFCYIQYDLLKIILLPYFR